MKSEKAIARPWTLRRDEVAKRFAVDVERGLEDARVQDQRHRWGTNRLKESRRKPAWRILIDQFENLIVLLLAIATGLSFLFGKQLEGFSILSAILINVGFGFFTELKAVRAMEALRRISRVTARVRRNGTIQSIASEKMVPGDIVLLETGDVIAADIRLIEVSGLRTNESTLTGESEPVDKQVEALDGDAPLAERSNMVFKGTGVSGGSGLGIVTATGMQTELGRIAALAEEAESEETPLEQRLNRLGHRLIWLTVAVAAAVVGIGLYTGKDLFLVVETAVALTVAAIPEGLPIVATIALARGMWRMFKYNALINRLSAVETLGTMTVICTDKTGTLTENRMSLERILHPAADPTRFREIAVDPVAGELEFADDGRRIAISDLPILEESLEIGVLCNRARLPEDADGEDNGSEASGDPLEIALLQAGRSVGMSRQDLLDAMPQIGERPFETATKMMATFHRLNDSLRVAVKGAPEAVLDACSRIRNCDGSESELGDELRTQWQAHNEEAASSGYRLLAIGSKQVDGAEENPYTDLTFLGLFGLYDPPRETVKSAIGQCQAAGIRVIMVTGDHLQTARSIALKVGLIADELTDARQGDELQEAANLGENRRGELLLTPIFARVTPKQKLDLIRLHQENGAVVAMTGDGINDAPALKKADIGIAMGRRGTQVAREAADMVLQDDAFETIVTAIAQGRAIFDNIRKFILFLLSGNVGEILIVAAAILAGAPLPILPLQILYLNMIGDVFPALALGVGRGDESRMNQPPRATDEPLLARRHWWSIGGYGILIAAAVLVAFAVALKPLGMDTARAVTVSFLTLSFARLWHVFNMRAPRTRIFRNDVVRNPYVWGALVLCTGLLLAAVYTPGLSLVLRLVDPGPDGWLLIGGMSLAPLIIGQVLKMRSGSGD
jgi:Ca2+-transporting ATPase